MPRRNFLPLIVAGGLIAVAAAFVPGRHASTGNPNGDVGYGADRPRFVGAMPQGCLQEPVLCGLLW